MSGLMGHLYKPQSAAKVEEKNERIAFECSGVLRLSPGKIQPGRSHGKIL